MKLIKIAIKRTIVTTMISISLLILGIFAMRSMRTELLPDIEYPVVKIITHWSGASAEDVEKQITNKIERILPNVEGIENISSESSYENSSISVEFNYGVNIQDKVTEIQREVFQIKNDLPNSAKNPIIKKTEVGAGAITLFLTFVSPDKKALFSYLENYVKPNLETISGVAEVSILGGTKKQLQIQIEPAKLASYNLTPMDIYQLIRKSSMVIPLGSLMNGREEYVIQALGELESVEEYENILLHSNGDTLRLKDIANVVLTEEDPLNLGFNRGKPATTIAISKSSDGSTIEINEKIMKAVKNMEETMPSNISYFKVFDSSESIKKSINTVGKSALQGLILASLFLWIFFKNKKMTLIVSFAFPLAISTTFILMKGIHSTFNLISLMGLAIGVGMLTDNSVVVIDNIYNHIQEEKNSIEAAFIGTNQVFSSVLASTLTSIIVFLPIIFTKGIFKEMFQDMVWAIIFSNVAALLVSVTFIPMLASKFMKKNIIQTEGKYFSKIQRKYQKFLSISLKHKKKTVLISLLFAFLIFGIGGKFVKFGFLTKQDYGYYSVIAEFQNGSDFEKIQELRNEIETIIKKEPHTKSYFSIIQKRNGTISVNVDVGFKEKRKESIFEIVKKVRKEVEKIPDIRTTFFYEYAKGKPKKDIEFQIVGTDLETIQILARQIYKDVLKIKGVTDVSSTLDSGGKKLEIIFKRDKIQSLNMSIKQIEETISYYLLGGDRANTITIKSGNEEIEVLVRLSKDNRKSIKQLENLKIKVTDNSFINLSEIADIRKVENQLSIDKINRFYSVSIYVNDGGIGTQKIQEELIKIFSEKNKDSSIQYRWGGDAEKMQRAMKELMLTFLIAIFLIYALLASQFESFLFPFLVMGSIPFSLVGVIIGFLITQHTLDAVAMVGIILLIGIVVNNAIVLLDFIQQEEKESKNKKEAIEKACNLRLRPILLTSLTTIVGMIPLSLGIGDGSEVYQGLGISIIFGMSFSTLLTLIFVPTTYYMLTSIFSKKL